MVQGSSGAGSARWRERVRQVLEHRSVQRTIIGLILVNAVILGLETSDAVMAAWGPMLLTLDSIILGLFVIEIVARIYVHRWAFFRDAWSVFDFLVVAIALVPASGPLAVLRALRVLRVFRLLGAIPSLRRVVAGLLGAVPGLSAVFGVMSLIFYVAAVISTNLFGDRFPDWFGSLGKSAYTLFQVMTLESWSMGIARPVIAEYPWAWLFFIPFILVATFTLLNLFIGVIVSALQAEHDAERAQAEQDRDQAIEDHLHAEVAGIKLEIAALRQVLLERLPER
jgi:voltage-gated sodium channel